jgi:hypothetical protein
LYDIQTQIVRLVDPRGSFGQKGIYGDPRYDIAKLRHSLCGQYDFIIANLFKLDKEASSFTFNLDIYKNDYHDRLVEYFDSLILELGYNLREIKLIESLLFLSMIPYHSGKPEHQFVMYLTGIKKLNTIFNI